ncbi:MAG: ferritin-like domain-containing protein [Fimbriimonadaceae bacterium]|nr:ferritin-like domain-containing protein [Fimbriimonadaceae bacterium]QYK54951.1 MAG: ferritin-like domain-containing protein [Fimbriimonadaceae bacterium]
MRQKQDLKDIYLHGLRDIYSAETQIIKALPKVIDAVTSKELKDALNRHLQETKQQAETVADIIAAHDEKPEGEHCKGMEGLLKEGMDIASEFEAGPTRDAALITACQKVEHYEISAYGSMRVFAKQLGFKDDVKALNSIFEEETNADMLMTEIAEGGLNAKADGEFASAGDRR